MTHPPGMAEIPPGDPVLQSPALDLVLDADRARRHGDAVTAERRLERALNLAQGSSWIYRQLAELRLEQNQPAAAEGFIRRALRYAGGASRQYRASLYGLLSVSLRRQGHLKGADDAMSEARRLQ